MHNYYVYFFIYLLDSHFVKFERPVTSMATIKFPYQLVISIATIDFSYNHEIFSATIDCPKQQLFPKLTTDFP